MSKILLPPEGGISLSRRRFVQGLAAAGTLLGIGLSPRLSYANQMCARMGPGVLSGSRFDLSYNPTPVNFRGDTGT